MAVDKLVDSTQLDADLTTVANAIRIKGGTSAQMAFPAGFVSAVQAIPTGTAPTGTKYISITQNGTTTEDVAAYANAEITVNVQGGGGVGYKSLLDDTFSGALISDITFLRNYAFAYVTGLTSIKLTNLTPNTSNSNQNLKDSSYCISYNPNLETLVITTEVRVGTSTVRNNPKLKAVDVPAVIVGGSCFSSDIVFDTLILRRNSLASMPATTAFTNTPFASGGTGGTIYVPQALIAEYQAANNWSTILGYANNQILPIEGSIYETQYADGTPIT